MRSLPGDICSVYRHHRRARMRGLRPRRVSTLGASCNACPSGKFSDRLGASSCDPGSAGICSASRARPQSSDAQPVLRAGLHVGLVLQRVPHGQAQQQVGREFMRRLPSWQLLNLNKHVRRARMHGLRPRKAGREYIYLLLYFLNSPGGRCCVCSVRPAPTRTRRVSLLSGGQ